MIIRIVVDLPDPLGPRNPVTAPAGTSKVKLSTAVVVPYRLVSECAVIISRNGKGRVVAAKYRQSASWRQG
jgi:hypothetical protein